MATYFRERVYFSFSDFSELIREVAPLVLFRPAPYFMVGLEYKLVTRILFIMVIPSLQLKIQQERSWEFLRVVSINEKLSMFWESSLSDFKDFNMSNTDIILLLSNTDIILLLSVAVKVKQAAGHIL